MKEQLDLIFKILSQFTADYVYEFEDIDVADMTKGEFRTAADMMWEAVDLVNAVSYEIEIRDDLEGKNEY